MEIDNIDYHVIFELNMKKIKTIRCDYWNHTALSKQVINLCQSKTIDADKLSVLDCVPRMKKPYFWEVWKFGEYKRECNRILGEVGRLLDESTRKGG